MAYAIKESRNPPLRPLVLKTFETFEAAEACLLSGEFGRAVDYERDEEHDASDAFMSTGLILMIEPVKA